MFEFVENPFHSSYGQFRSADDLLHALAKQKLPPIYHDEAQSMKVAQSPAAVFFKYLLRLKEGLHAMKEFCSKRHVAENFEYALPYLPFDDELLTSLFTVRFYRRVDDFQHKYNSHKEIHHVDLERDAKAIIDNFIGPDATKKLRLPLEVLTKAQARIGSMVFSLWNEIVDYSFPLFFIDF